MTGILIALIVLITLLSGSIYHLIFLKAAREGWSFVTPLIRLLARDEFAQRDRFMRENLDAMAKQVGEMNAKLVRLEAMSERVAELAGLNKSNLMPTHTEPPTTTFTDIPKKTAEGGPFVPDHAESLPTPLQQLSIWAASVDERVDQSTDLLIMVESSLFENRLAALMVPNSRPLDGPVGSGFGFRIDPFTGRAALHTGLDFPSPEGTPIYSAAGGVVIASDLRPDYGQVVELDHGKGLVTRYAHTSKVLVKVGEIIRRGQLIAHVGSTGRSTGSHLHFEVLLDGVQQDPSKFLASGPALISSVKTPSARAASPRQ
jgi:murein DD-endopeptidase MepM/ murein hydrolase activator NlpD